LPMAPSLVLITAVSSHRRKLWLERPLDISRYSPDPSIYCWWPEDLNGRQLSETGT
jgi:hypothetical protein